MSVALFSPKRKVILLLCAMLLAASSGVAEQAKRAVPSRRTLSQRLEAILHRREARRGFWGIEIVQLPAGRRLYTRNADHLFVPASNMKLFTSAAALEKLGPDFVFPTTVESPSAPDAAGRVPELVLVGRGDPHLGSRAWPYQGRTERQNPADRDLQELADQVRARGVREVTGDLVADTTYFLDEPPNPTWAVEDLAGGYGSPVTALAFNDNTLELRIRPGVSAGVPAQVVLDPVPDCYRVTNRVVTGSAGSERRIAVERTSGLRELIVEGQLPVDSPEVVELVTMENPPELVGELLRRALEQRGIKVRGRVVVWRVSWAETSQAGAAAPPRVVLAEHVSPPLAEGLKVVNKTSQNLHAEMLLRTLGREIKNSGSTAAGLEVLREFTAQVGIAPDEFRFADGSGLSRQALITPHALIRLLEYMARSPRFGTFYDSLPVAGVDGTLADRFKRTRAASRIHAKTGTLEHTNALSGYMDLASGKRLAFSVVGNSHLLTAAEGAAVIDRLVLAIYGWYVPRSKPARKVGARN